MRSPAGRTPPARRATRRSAARSTRGATPARPARSPAGWWKADRSSYCGGAARYYIDCNAKPGTHFHCHCNRTNCDHRRVACNIFRYGQCNTQIPGVTAVVCRQISCRPPWQLYPGHCGRASATDNNTALHTAPCLTRKNTFPALKVFPKALPVLAAGHGLTEGQRRTAPNRHTTLTFTARGDLQLLNQDGIIWHTRTSPRAAGGRAQLYRNGDLVVLDRHGRLLWHTDTGHPNAKPVLRLLNSGRLVLFDHGREVWGTHTHTP